MSNPSGDAPHDAASAEDQDVPELTRQRIIAERERYRQLFESITDTVLVIDQETRRLLEANRAAVDMYGYSREELLQLTDLDLTAEPEQTQALTQRYGEEQPRTIHVGRRLFRRKDGTTFPAKISARVFPLDGRLVRLGIVRDISDRESAAAELRESETRLHRALAAVGAGIWEWDMETGLSTWSDELWRLYDLDPHSCSASYEAWLASVLPDDQAVVSAAVTGAAARCEPFYAEWRVATRDGSERWLGSHASPERDDAGNVVRYLGVVVDISARRLAEAALHDNELRHRTLFESMPQGVVYQAADGTIIAANPAAERILGLSLDQLQGRTSADPRWRSVREDGSDFPGEEHPASIALATGREVHDVTMGVFSPAEDEYHWIIVDAVPQFRPGEDRPHQVYTTFDDITERRRAAAEILRLNTELEAHVQSRTAQLAATNEELEAFAYSVSHDLRAPLRAIDGFSQLVAEAAAERLTPDEIADLQRVRAGAQRMGALIDDLLELSRTGRHRMDVTVVDVTALAEQIAEELRESGPGRDVQVTVGTGLHARGDASLLRIVLMNLLGNAWKFTSRSSSARIEVGAQDTDAENVFFVRDDGAGFDEANAGRLFTAFHRLHPPGEFEGSGIGLATVRRIVARHGGRVWAAGEPEKGATFWFTLPKRYEPD